MLWIIVGLGNPGEEYKNTRHNTGRAALEYFAAHNELPEIKEDKRNKISISRGALAKATVMLIAPDTYMNKSGSAIAKYVKSAKAAQQLIVIYDDLDLPLGTMKVSFDRGSGGHKGLESVIRAVKTRKFTRVRIGISPTSVSGKLKKPNGDKAVQDFILGAFSTSERELTRRIFRKASDAVRAVIEEGLQRAMNEFN